MEGLDPHCRGHARSGLRMPVGTLNSSTYRRRSGHAVWMEIDKKFFHLAVSDQAHVVLPLTFLAFTARGLVSTKIVQKKAGFDCDAAARATGVCAKRAACHERNLRSPPAAHQRSSDRWMSHGCKTTKCPNTFQEAVVPPWSFWELVAIVQGLASTPSTN